MVGLAIAKRLAVREGPSSTVLIERNEMVGMETSSRNSEVCFVSLDVLLACLPASLLLARDGGGLAAELETWR